jgi:hypothetical protein
MASTENAKRSLDPIENPGERLKTAAVGAMSAAKTETVGEAGEKETPTVAEHNAVQAIIENFPEMSKKSALQMIDKYGLPNEAIPSEPSSTATKSRITFRSRTRTCWNSLLTTRFRRRSSASWQDSTAV